MKFYQDNRQHIKKTLLARLSGYFVLGDFRKCAEQYGGAVECNESNRVYILTPGVFGINRSYYKHPLLKCAYDVYMNYWKGVCFV